MVMLYTKLKHKAREIKDLTDMGLVDTHWLRDLEIFEKFHAMEEWLPCKACRYEKIAEEVGLSSERVKKIILLLGN